MTVQPFFHALENGATSVEGMELLISQIRVRSNKIFFGHSVFLQLVVPATACSVFGVVNT